MSYRLSLLLIALCCMQLCNGLAHLVKLNDAVNDGAMCLDGTPQAYYYRKGYGSGAKKWIVHLEGGGWCYTEADCVERSKTDLGSSKNYVSAYAFSGLLSASSIINPNFYNWNMVFVAYCDGVSFLGNVNKPVDVNRTIIYFRGFKNLQAVLKSLETLGSREAEDFILTGCSAGGLSAYIHADYVHTQLSPTTKYAVIPDAGFFINAASLQGDYPIQEGCEYVFKIQNTSEALDHDCVKAYSPDEQWKCMIAPYTYPYITSPVFSINSFYDTWQLANTLKLDCLPPYCNAEQLAALKNYGKEFLEAAKDVINSESSGVWFDSCFQHCQTIDDITLNKVKVDGQTFSETIRYWYDKSGGKTKVVDCAYPCNHSC